MDPGETRTVTLESGTAHVRRAARFCRQAAADLMPTDAANLVELAVAEAFTNICRHAFPDRDHEPIQLSLIHEGSHFTVLLQDHSPVGFDPALVPDPRLDHHDIMAAPEGGWGVFIIREAMDDVSYTRINGRNCLRLSKKLAGTAGVALPFPAPPPEIPPPAVVTALRRELAASEDTVQQMAEELSQSYEHLNVLYTFSHDVAALTDRKVLLEKILGRATASVGAHWAVLRLLDNGQLVHKAAQGAPADTPPAVAVNVDSAGIEGRVARTRKEEVSTTADGKPLLCLPLLAQEMLLGTLLLGGTERANGFSAADAKLAHALADQAAFSLENQDLLHETIQSKLAIRELEVAHELQRRLYPRDVPDIPGYRLFADGIPALVVGGDYLAVRPLEPGQLDLVIADAMGKGMTAAFFSSLTHIAFRCIQDLTPQHSPGEILRTCNRVMGFDFDRFGMFITALYGRLDTRCHRLTYASAGHCPPLVSWPDGRTEFLEPIDFMLGVDVQTVYHDRTVQLEPGTRVLLYTDGFTDVVDESGHVLGPEALRNAWMRLRHKPIPDACRTLLDDTRRRWAAHGLQDDIAVIGFERLESP